MTSADRLRRENDSTDRDHDRYGCEDCGLPLETDYDACPECGGTNIVPLGDLIDSSFRE
jgi:rubrerythrin